MSHPRLLAALALFPLLPVYAATAGDNEEETSWEHAPSSYKAPADLVYGGAFIDRIRPMPVGPEGLRSDVWGGKNVKPRNVQNGIEDPKWSYWCMSVHKDPADGKEHMFGARWPESAKNGHMSWFGSHTFHAVADSPMGPFRVVEEDIGPGHNVTCFRAKDGSYVICANGCGYVSKTVNGPWKPLNIRYDARGTPSGEMTNHKFAVREDGSVLMISRGGRTWISEDGLQPFRKITNKSAYPPIKGSFEDPEVWRDEVQYHLIVNDWFGRSAYYLRSKDGVNWVWDQGLAYDPTVAKHEDGSVERWYKFERPGVRQDEFGRATHIYFAVIDSRKDLDKANDNHSSKIIALPLTVQRRLELLDKPAPGATSLRVRIKAEPGFNPKTDVAFDSLRFGAPSAVDYGKGLKVTKTESSGADVIATFGGGQAGFTAEDFAAKLLGKDAKGALLFGYSRIPGVKYDEPILNAPPVRFTASGASVTVENFGRVPSVPGKLSLVCRGASGAEWRREVALPAIKPYGKADVAVPCDFSVFAKSGKAAGEIAVDGGGAVFRAPFSFTMLSARGAANTPLELSSALTDNSGWGDSKKNRNISGKPLEVGSVTFEKGFGTHAPAEQSWLLDGAFDSLSFKVGVDKTHHGSVTVQVWGDDRLLKETPKMKGGAEPVSVEVPVRGVRLLKIVTTDGGDGSSQDHANFGDPVLRTAKTK